MEKRIAIIIAAIIGAVLIGMAMIAFFALRTSNEILEEFQRVNNGLESAHLTLEDRQDRTRSLFASFECQEMAVHADSIHNAYIDLTALIDSFKVGLVIVAMDNTHAADSVFAAAGRGAQLHKAFTDFFELAERTCANDSIDRQIDQYAQIVRDKPTAEEWRMANFEGVPAVACITILSKFRSDAASAETLVLNDLLARCDPAWKK